MDRDRWQQIELLFHTVVEGPREQRVAMLAAACGEDRDLFDQVTALLDADEGGATSDRGRREERDPLLGSQIGPYTLLRELGQGGMGKVYAAARADEGYERRVALKLLRHGPLPDELRRRFDSERRILARLEHPNIARLLDGGTTAEGVAYLVLELVDGEPIDRWCEARKLSPRARLELFQKVCLAVGAAHRGLVVHRDLKPSNILIRRDGEPKLLDFGISEMLDDEREGGGGSEATVRPLTPGYASPEQLAGGAVSTPSDLFSLGVVLFELLAGYPPYSEEQLFGMAMGETTALRETVPPERSVTSGKAPTPAALPSGLGLRFAGDVESVVHKALAARPADRYRSADELADDLGRYLNQRPVIANPGNRRQRGLRFVARHRPAVVAGLVLAALSLGLVVALSTLALQRGQQRDRMRAERDRARATAGFLNDVFEHTGRFEGESPTADLLARNGEQLIADLAVDRGTRATLDVTLGRLLVSLGKYEAAQPLLEEAVELRRAELPPLPLELAEAEHQLARLFTQAGEYQRAEELERSALASTSVAGGESAALRISSLGNLGWLLGLRGEYEESERLLEEAVDLARGLFGETSGEVADRLESLAFVNSEQGKLTQARELCGRAVAIRRKAVAANHPALAMSLKNLAIVELNLGHHELAVEPLEEALEIEREVLGSEHPATAGTLDKLAQVRMRQGDLDAAAELIREALAGRRKTLGEIHPRVAETLGRQAELLRRLGDLPAAAEASRQSLEVARASLPPGAPMLAFPLELYAAVEVQRDRPEQAEPLLREALAVRRAALPPDSPLIPRSLTALAACLETLGRRDEASALAQESVERLLKNEAEPGPALTEAQELVARLRNGG